MHLFACIKKLLKSQEIKMSADAHKVYKKVLENGLTVLVRPTHSVPKVSIQLWYNVGSKEEESCEKGIAHLIEHMIFKGTNTLSESDINLITNKLSGVCNAFTSYDYTGYLFDFPSHHWQEALPIMADCMSNCTFKPELLKSEMKAVIQELKMYKDNYASSVIEQMISTIFSDHPYHFPIIGFKQDLWNLNRENLVAFYKKHYVPNNATLVVVGDVQPENVFALAQENFGAIPANHDYKRAEYYYTQDIASTAVTLYRDVQQPIVALAFVIPGAKECSDYVLDVLSFILGSGKSSRLQKKLIDELQLVTEIETFNYDLFDQGVFFIYFQPKNTKQIEEIIAAIQAEIDDIIANGLTKEELLRATKQAEYSYLDTLENNQKQAYLIGKAYLATGDENYLFNYLKHSHEKVAQEIKELLSDYFRSSLMHRGTILPLQKKDLKLWKKVQERSDAQDARILGGIVRESIVEQGVHVDTITVKEAAPFHFPQPSTFTLPNGLKVLYYNNPNLPKIDIVVDFKAKHYYDPQDEQGLNNFMSNMLLEGTKNYPGNAFADTVEMLGMNIETAPGYISISLLSTDLHKALELLHELVHHATFDEISTEKVREQLLSDIKNFWDNPSQFINQLAREEIYQHHPYAKNPLGTAESIQALTREALIECYKQNVTPQETTLIIVGDLNGYDIQKLVTQLLHTWQGPKVADIKFPEVAQTNAREINFPMNRDQVVLAFAGKSITRDDKDFDNILLFDQIFTGGVLGSMSSRLFELREQTGLFYTIGGSLLAHTDTQPGIEFIKTIVSNDRLKEAETAIAKTIDTASNVITDQEFTQAKDALINSMIGYFETNKQMASAFLFLERFDLPFDYFDNRAKTLHAIEKQQVQDAVKRLLNTKHLIKIRVGRI